MRRPTISVVGRLFCFCLATSIAVFAAPPFYTSSSIVSAASNLPGPLVPYGIYTIYGDNLSTATLSSSPTFGSVPTNLGPGGLRVLVDSSPAGLFYVSPHQVNFLVPASITPGIRTVTVIRDALLGPTVRLACQSAAPALFASYEQSVIATHLSGQTVTAESPARPGAWVILYATGLGLVTPLPADLGVAARPAQVQNPSSVAVWLNGQAAGFISYAGVTPGFGGLYQVNYRLPVDAPENPEIRLIVNGQISPGGLTLPVVHPIEETGKSQGFRSATTRSAAKRTHAAPSPAATTRGSSALARSTR